MTKTEMSLSWPVKAIWASVGATFGDMDVLTYAYDSGNKVLRIDDSGNDAQGFRDGTNTNDDFEYDGNGNLKVDRNKGIASIAYNHLNMPTLVDFGGTGNIGTVYAADGTKLKKTASNGTVTEYANGYVYENGSLQFLAQPEGYITPDNGDWRYVYQYRDHLGNIRLSYTNDPSNPGTPTIIEENNYYPFGLEHKGYNNVVNGTENQWKYQGKEHEEELGLNTYDFGARNYMPDLGRWTTIDPLSEDFYDYSPYNSMLNNPVMFIDPDGRAAMSPIYNTDGDFLGTDDEGLQGKAIVMNEENFTQGMSHDEALSNSLGAEGLSSKEAGTKLLSNYNGLKDRPDYDGFVTVSEGVDWAKSHPGALDNPTAENTLYLDASKLDFGNLSVSNFTTVGSPEPQNLLNAGNLAASIGNEKLRATVYALGRVDMRLNNKATRNVSIMNNSATDYDWNTGGGTIRSTLINAERARTGINDSHGFKTYYYGTGTLNKPKKPFTPQFPIGPKY